MTLYQKEFWGKFLKFPTKKLDEHLMKKSLCIRVYTQAGTGWNTGMLQHTLPYNIFALID